ncbi:ketopantoate reductase family protein [Allomeiothermus silvanus]|uniref:ketopantoate reductase family protein n=1 Tax=Allomeiothermus silvanus TaxID=52022 RepID=UPI0023F1E4F7|nr:2-dehydropantoate 2-reductase N-terminal domain-containing protein [Allomeiothermus silvanus]
MRSTPGYSFISVREEGLKITIIGSGAIGGLAGSHMTRAGYDVVLVDQWKEHVEAMNARGLFIDGIRGEMTLPVRAITPDQLPAYVEKTGPLEAVLIATKSQHTEGALRQILPLVTPETFIVSFQNGFNEPVIADILSEAGLGGMERVVGSIPNYGGALVDPGYLEFVHEGPIQLGEMSTPEFTPRLLELAKMLESLTNIQLSPNIWGQIWAKEVYSQQVVFSALADAPIHETLGVERYARIAGAVVREALEIAEANGIKVEAFDFFDPANYKPQTPDDTQKLIANIQHAIWLLKKDQKPTQHEFKKKGSGIWWDIVYRKRPSEVGAMNGKLIEYGKKAGADTRLVEKLANMIFEIERGERQLGFHNYDELEAYVRGIGKELP